MLGRSSLFFFEKGSLGLPFETPFPSSDVRIFGGFGPGFWGGGGRESGRKKGGGGGGGGIPFPSCPRESHWGKATRRKKWKRGVVLGDHQRKKQEQTGFDDLRRGFSKDWLSSKGFSKTFSFHRPKKAQKFKRLCVFDLFWPQGDPT